MSAVVVDEIEDIALRLEAEPLRQLTHEAMRLLHGASTPPVPMDDDPVAALLKGYLDLPRDDKRRFRTMLARIARKERMTIGGAA